MFVTNEVLFWVMRKEHCIAAEFSMWTHFRHADSSEFGTQVWTHHPWAKLDNCTNVFFWFVFVFSEVNSQHPWHRATTKVCDVTVCHLQRIHERLFSTLWEFWVCKASVFFGTKQFSLYSCFLKDFSQNTQTEKIEKVSHPAFLIEEKKKKITMDVNKSLFYKLHEE